ncbi:MAG: hypothetical protein HY849_00260 [Nitrosomonadales bacterium]|nr:hypothetical protein [Nitrosomonadales bacterium]
MAHITLQSLGQPVADFGVSGMTIAIAGTQIDCAALQEDGQVLLNIVRDKSGSVRINPEGGGACLAIIRIPAKQYHEADGEPDPHTGEPTRIRAAVPLDPNAIDVELWPTV